MGWKKVSILKDKMLVGIDYGPGDQTVYALAIKVDKKIIIREPSPVELEQIRKMVPEIDPERK